MDGMTWMTVVLVLSPLAFLAGCQRTAPEEGKDTPEVPFQVMDGQGLTDVDTSPPPEAWKNTTDLMGRVEDTGELNMFTVFHLQGDAVLSRRLYLATRVYEDPHGSAWMRLVGNVSGEMHGSPAFATDSLGPIEGLDAKLERAVKDACALVEARRPSFDLNAYKATDRFQRALSEHADKDLNALPFESAGEVVFVDRDVRTAGIDCGRVVLRRDPVRGDFLTFMAYVLLDEMRIARVVVRNTGYFME